MLEKYESLIGPIWLFLWDYYWVVFITVTVFSNCAFVCCLGFQWSLLGIKSLAVFKQFSWAYRCRPTVWAFVISWAAHSSREIPAAGGQSSEGQSWPDVCMFDQVARAPLWWRVVHARWECFALLQPWQLAWWKRDCCLNEHPHLWTLCTFSGLLFWTCFYWPSAAKTKTSYFKTGLRDNDAGGLSLLLSFKVVKSSNV